VTKGKNLRRLTYNFQFLTRYSEVQAGSGPVKHFNESGTGTPKSEGSERIQNTGLYLSNDKRGNLVCAGKHQKN
jgi:hypothetical protein